RAGRAAAPRLSADPRDLASRGARPARALHGGVRGFAWVRRQWPPAVGSDPRALLEARDGARSGRGHGGARRARRARREPDARRVEPDRPGQRTRELPLAAPGPAGALAGAPDRRRSRFLPGLAAALVGLARLRLRP